MNQVGSGTVQVLDHGYVKLVQSWGSDEFIVESARMSTAKGFLGWEADVTYTCPVCNYVMHDTEPVDKHLACPAKRDHGQMDYKLVHPSDERLLKTLMHSTPPHTSPFEFGGFIIEVMCPIFVIREWHRHRTQSYQEMSARYTPLPDVNYIPTLERCLLTSATNKQAGTVAHALDLTDANFEAWRTSLVDAYEKSERVYREGLSMGIPKEVARSALPVGRYTRMRATANLWNWFHFLKLRLHPAAQWEIRQYANVVGQIAQHLFPRSYALFEEKRPK